MLSYFLFKNVPAPIMRLTPKEQEKLLLHAAGKLMSLGKDERRLCRTLYPHLLGKNSFLFFYAPQPAIPFKESAFEYMIDVGREYIIYGRNRYV